MLIVHGNNYTKYWDTIKFELKIIKEKIIKGIIYKAFHLICTHVLPKIGIEFQILSNEKTSTFKIKGIVKINNIINNSL